VARIETDGLRIVHSLGTGADGAQVGSRQWSSHDPFWPCCALAWARNFGNTMTPRCLGDAIPMSGVIDELDHLDLAETDTFDVR
jgi:hypothetical protein